MIDVSETRVPVPRVVDDLPNGSEQSGPEFFSEGPVGAGRWPPTKYLIWYSQIIDRARGRQLPRCYTEVHHIKPRSLGGGNEDTNLVRLTYREHFLVHWILTKICSGGDLRRMQRALFAMTMPLSGNRIISGWQFELAKRAVRDLELDPALEAKWLESYRAEQEAKRLRSIARSIEEIRKTVRGKRALEKIVIPAKSKAKDLSAIASKFLSTHKKRRNVRRNEKPIFDQSLPRAERVRLWNAWVEGDGG